jgi:hypothetical protein
MKIKQIALLTFFITLLGFSAQSISAQVQRANVLSDWNKTKPAYLEKFSDEGGENQIISLKARTIELMIDRVELSNVDSETAKRKDLLTSVEVRNNVNSAVKLVWSNDHLDMRTSDILAGWNLAKEDPNYEPYTDVNYSLDSWQGIRISPDGKSAEAVVTGRLIFDYRSRTMSDSLFQSQIKLVLENGIWLFEDTVAIWLGEPQ